MFIEDLRRDIIPIGGKRITGEPFSINLTPNNTRTNMMTNLLFKTDWQSFHDIYHSTEQSTSLFIENCAKWLLLNGTLYYEIAPVLLNPEKFSDEERIEKPLFMLLPIPGKLVRIGKIFIQLIPPYLWKKEGKKFVILSAKSVWKVTIPKPLGGHNATKEMLKNLIIMGGKDKFLSELMNSASNEKNFFDIKKYYKEADLNVAQITNSWGWDMRTGIYEHTLEYYQVYRRIKSAYALALFREHLFREMNMLIKRLDYEYHIEVIGLPSSKEIHTIFQKLSSNDISFKDVFNITYIQ